MWKCRLLKPYVVICDYCIKAFSFKKEGCKVWEKA